MSKIHNKNIKIKPKIYFIFGSSLTLIGLISSTIVSMFLVGLIRFSFRNHGMMSNYKFNQMIYNFPWWTFVFAILSLAVGLYLIKRYDFSYKIKPWMIVLIFILTVIFSGILIDILGINDVLKHRGPTQRMMNNYLKENTTRGIESPKKLK